MSILTVEDLSFSYDKEKFVLKDLNMDFEESTVYGIFGRSGAGKSTLLSLLAGLETSEYGHIYYRDSDLFKMNLDNYRAKEIGMIFQSYNLLPQFTAAENVVLAMDISNIKIDDKKKKAYSLLKKVGLSEDLFERRILRLSGGEQQRVAIARALANDSSIILADEPTGNLDPHMEDEIIDLLINIAHKDKKCVIIISHSKDVRSKVDKVFHLVDGTLNEKKEIETKSKD